MHPLDDALRLDPLAEGRWRGRTTPAYANMVGPFGGTLAASLLQAALLQPEKQGEPIALTVNFAAPVADGPFEIVVRAVRTNRSTQHWTMELSQGDGIAAIGSAVFARRRETWSAAEAEPPPDVPAPETLPRSVLPISLPWTDHYDMRFARGGFESATPEGAEQADSVSHVWLRDDPPRPLDVVALAALADAFFPRVFVRRRWRVPIGTVSLTTYFHADAAQLATHGTAYLLGTAQALRFRNGYFDQSASLWGAGGELFASSHQIVYYRE